VSSNELSTLTDVGGTSEKIEKSRRRQKCRILSYKRGNYRSKGARRRSGFQAAKKITSVGEASKGGRRRVCVGVCRQHLPSEKKD